MCRACGLKLPSCIWTLPRLESALATSGVRARRRASRYINRELLRDVRCLKLAEILLDVAQGRQRARDLGCSPLIVC